MIEAKKQLLEFFSSPYNQTTLYTCGPAVVRMVAEYYEMLATHNRATFGEINKAIFTLESELFLSKLFNTTEEHGTDAFYMAKKIKEMGCHVEYGQVKTKNAIIESFPSRFKSMLEEGIPIIVNYTYHLNKNDFNEKPGTVGHFGIIYKIDDSELFIADPAAHFGFNVGGEQMAIPAFLNDWKNGTGLVGIFLIIYPNEQMYKKYSDPNGFN